MEIEQNRRRWIRQVLSPPEIGILYTGNKGFVPGHHVNKQPSVLFVDLLNRSLGGVIIRTKWQIGQDSEFYLQIFSELEEDWELVKVVTKWSDSDPQRPGYNIIGVEYQEKEPAAPFTIDDPATRKLVPLPSDYKFFRSADIFNVVPRDAVCAMLNSVTYKHVKAGRRLMKQGAKIETCYIIQSGSCAINLEKDGQLLPIGRRKEGEIIGQEAILDDLPLVSHVDAETEMELWGLTRSGFDTICADYPEMRSFLTNLLKDRFAPTRHSEKRKIGRFLITDEIAEGPRSIIYKGAHRSLNLPVFIKMIKHSVSLERGFMGNFQKEAQTATRLNHPNIAKIYRIEDRLRTVFVIMEYLEGEPLDSLIRRWKNIPLPRSVDFLLQAVSGLDYAHNKGIVHQALKPNNLFVSPGDRLKILDFGLPLAGEIPEREGIGTLPYQAPEQQAGKGSDPRVDIYALGVIAYEMITGTVPLPKDKQTTESESKPVIPDPVTTVPDMPDILLKFIKKACDPDPGDRFRDAAQALTHLKPLVKVFDLPHRKTQEEEENIATLSLVYREKDQLALNELMEEFSEKIKELNAQIKSVVIREHSGATENSED